jgi:glyoxylase-like metal-dependent hydrolase (beta-lactamase superfamily II)
MCVTSISAGVIDATNILDSFTMMRCEPLGRGQIHPIRGVMGCCHLLVDENRHVVLLDTGLVGEPILIRRKLHRLGLGPSDVKAILLTHGHIDHAGNVAWAKRWTGPPFMPIPWNRHISTENFLMRESTVGVVDWKRRPAYCSGLGKPRSLMCHWRMGTNFPSGAA